MIIIIIIIIIIKGNTNLPSQNIPLQQSTPITKSTPTTPQMEAHTATVKEHEPSTVVAKTSTLRAARILDPLHS